MLMGYQETCRPARWLMRRDLYCDDTGIDVDDLLRLSHLRCCVATCDRDARRQDHQAGPVDNQLPIGRPSPPTDNCTPGHDRPRRVMIDPKSSSRPSYLRQL